MTDQTSPIEVQQSAIAAAIFDPKVKVRDPWARKKGDATGAIVSGGFDGASTDDGADVSAGAEDAAADPAE